MGVQNIKCPKCNSPDVHDFNMDITADGDDLWDYKCNDCGFKFTVRTVCEVLPYEN